jgi:Protein of unknown function (DUF2867)
MSLVECEVPAASVLDRGTIDAAYFRDAYRAPLQRADASVIDLFFAVLGHHPAWMKLALVVRNRIASLGGLEAPSASELLSVKRKSIYRVGDKIGVWPIFAISDTELVAGRDNHHLDFRLSVLREAGSGQATVTISTVCTVHNTFGKIYLFCIIPFHKWGVRRLIRAAVKAGRL